MSDVIDWKCKWYKKENTLTDVGMEMIEVAMEK